MTHYANRAVGNVAKHRVPGKMISGLNDRKEEIAPPSFTLTVEHVEFFVRHYLLNSFDDPAPTPQFHREMWEMCLSPNRHVAIAAPREHAKSTAITLGYVLAMVLFRQKDFVLILSDTYGQAVEFLRDIKTVLFENDLILQDFQTQRTAKDVEDDVIVMMKDGHKFRIVAKGSEQKVRGLKWDHKRPNLVIFDDVEGDEQVENAERRRKFRQWILRAVLPVGTNQTAFRWVGTVLHHDSALQRFLTDKTWYSKKFTAHKSYDDFSEILWPERKSEAQLRAIRQTYIEQGDPDGYSQEYLNNPIADGERYFPDPVEMDRDAKGYIRPSMIYYVGWDFAVSTQTKADYTAYTVVGVDSAGNKLCVFNERARLDSKGIVDLMFHVERKWKPQLHFVEKGVIDLSIEPFLNTQMLDQSLWLSIYKLPSSKDKPTRAKTMQGMMRAKHIKFDFETHFFPDLAEEMRRFPKGGHDDMVDSLCIIGLGLQELAPAYTQEETDQMEYEEEFGIETTGRNEHTGY